MHPSCCQGFDIVQLGEGSFNITEDGVLVLVVVYAKAELENMTASDIERNGST
jgi:hypothetical protein